jgi:KipI family sensor histidine kinase inhibitor
VRFLPYGDTGLLVDTDGDVDLVSLRAAIIGSPGVVDAVPAARTLLVEFDPARTTSDRLERDLATAYVQVAQDRPGELIRIGVTYDGADLGDVADAAGLTVAQVIERHVAPTYTVAFCGFAPGFAYLTGLDPKLHAPRLVQPRTSVPAGSVGVAGEFTGIYPRSSPGGWRLLGRTDAALWDVERDPPALLQPGAAVRFEPS